MASVQEKLITERNYSATAKAQQEKALGSTKETNASMQSQEFLQLLTMQLQYQDPTNPMDNSDMLAQEAQFTTLEQMEALTISFSKFSAAYQANSLLGQNVEVNVDGKTTTGKVEYVDYSDSSGASISIDGKQFPLTSVSKVYPQNTEISSQDDEDRSFIKEALSYIAGNIGTIAESLLGSKTYSAQSANTTDN